MDFNFEEVIQNFEEVIQAAPADKREAVLLFLNKEVHACMEFNRAMLPLAPSSNLPVWLMKHHNKFTMDWMALLAKYLNSIHTPALTDA
jgi:hypothetical protein